MDVLTYISVYFTCKGTRNIWRHGNLNVEKIVKDIKIITYHQKLADVLKEAYKFTSKKEWKHSHVFSKATPYSSSHIIEAISSLIKTKASLRSNKVDQVATLACVETLSGIIIEQNSLKCRKRHFIHLLSEENRHLVRSLIYVMCKLFHKGKLDLKSFVKIYFSLEDVPPEILWLFHESGFVAFTSYVIENICHPQEISKFTTSLSTIICYGDDDEVLRKVSLGLLSPLVSAVYGSAPGMVSLDLLSSHKQGLRTVLSSILHKVNEQLLPMFPKDKYTGFIMEDVTEKDIELNPVDIYGLLATSQVCGEQNSQIILSFFSNQLAETLKFSPDVTLNQAFLKQNEWSYSKVPEHLRKLLTSLLLPFKTKDALEIIKKNVNGGEVDWRIMLSFLSVYIVTKDGSGTLMKEFVSSLVQEAFAKSCRESLALALLTARQCGAEGCGFPSYAEWFASMFGARGTWGNAGNADNGRTSMSSFRFLMSLITDLVPVENVCGLRAHVSCPPHAPASATARGILSDYLHLARTRLSDFGALLGERGLFRSNQLGSDEVAHSGPSLVESEIEFVLSSFEKTGNILRAVLEASVFRKRYLEQTFLPELLKPRCLPLKPDTKMKVIETLTSKGLISATMHSNYLKRCEEERIKTQESKDNTMHF